MPSPRLLSSYAPLDYKFATHSRSRSLAVAERNTGARADEREQQHDGTGMIDVVAVIKSSQVAIADDARE